jgi:D-alanine-D-alanine ligase
MKSLKILLLCDIGEPPPKNQDFSEILKSEDWAGEAILMKTFKKLGHEPEIFALYDSIEPLYERLKSDPPDLVFNQCECIRQDRKTEPWIAGFLDLMGIPYTGAKPGALTLCKDKSLTKKILSYHRIPLPRFVVSKKSHPIRKLTSVRLPTFTKPLGLEGSEGIAQMSFSDNEKDTLERVQFIHRSLKTDAIVEEYIEGRELYVGVMGNERKVKTFPPRELFFQEVPEGEPKIATFKAKWDEQYRKKWGIKSGFAKSLPSEIEKELSELSIRIYQTLGMSGYGRMDFRLTPDGRVVFIEANPNPSLLFDEDFALAAEKAGLEYSDLIDQIIRQALRT